MRLEDRLRQRLAELAGRGLERHAPAITDRDGIRYRVDGRPVVGLCSNDYLGFADDPRLRAPFDPIVAAPPAGAGGSRLICGDLPVHRALERTLAELVGSEDAVLFPSGFQLNVGVLPALVDDADVVHSDALNHASLIDGLRLSRARIQILPHREAPQGREREAPDRNAPHGRAREAPDRDAPQGREREAPDRNAPQGREREAPDRNAPQGRAREAPDREETARGPSATVGTTTIPLSHTAVPSHSLHWWISESIFSMDGDRLDPAALVRHHARGGASYVDEAHAFGLFPGAQGLLGAHGVAPTALVCTLSKALGVAGAFVGAAAPTCDWIRTRARSYVFSTGTSPAIVQRIAAAIELARGPVGDDRRERLWEAAAHLADRLGLPSDAPSPIVPILVGDNATAVAMSSALLECGWHVQAIRPPTVPEGTARLRITVSAGHDRATLDAFVDDLFALCDRHRISPRVERGRVTPLGASR